jgi:hypothetical protein
VRPLSEAAPRTSGVGVVLVAVAVAALVPVGAETAAAGTEAEARAAIVAVGAGVAALIRAASLAPAAADEVIVAVLADGAGIASIEPTAATEATTDALLGATRALERPAATTAPFALGRLARGALVGTVCRIGGGGFTGGGGLEALLELRTIGGELFFELITVLADALAAAAEAGIAGQAGALRGEVAATFDVIGVELTLLAKRVGRASHRGGAIRRCRR